MDNNTRVCADELQALANSATVSNLDRESGKSSSIKEGLDSFINGSELSGEGWDTVKSKLGEYASALNEGSQISSELSAKISAAIAKLQPFFDNYDSLDPANLPELRQVLQELQTTLASLPETVCTGSYKDQTTGETKYTYGPNPLIPEYQEEIRSVEEFIDVLERFEAACNEVLASLQDVFSRIDAFESSTSNIVPSKIFTYAAA